MKEDLRIEFEDTPPNSAEEANRRFGNTVLKNICDNIEITYVWAGFGPPPTSAPDPQNGIISATVSGGGTLRPATVDFNTWLLSLRGLIMGLTISPPVGFALAPMTFNPASMLTVTMMPTHDTYDAAMTAFCDQLVRSILSTFANPVPVGGANGGMFQGSATGMVIR